MSHKIERAKYKLWVILSVQHVRTKPINEHSYNEKKTELQEIHIVSVKDDKSSIGPTHLLIIMLTYNHSYWGNWEQTSGKKMTTMDYFLDYFSGLCITILEQDKTRMLP